MNARNARKVAIEFVTRNAKLVAKLVKVSPNEINVKAVAIEKHYRY